MIRIVISVLLLIPLCGCTPREAKDIVRNKHAVTYVLSRKLHDDDKTNDPTYEQLKGFVKTTSKDWESMDRLLNNWKPKNEGIQSVDLEGRTKEEREKPERIDE